MSDAAVIASLAEVGAGEVAIVAAKVTPWIALGIGLVMLAGRWLLGRRTRITHLVILPPASADEVIDDALPRFFAHKPQAAPWPDGDTVTIDAVTDQEENRG